MKQYLIYIITLAILIIIVVGIYIIRTKKKTLPDIEKIIKETTQKTEIFDINTDHNQALDVIEHAQKQGIKTPKILVNFDTHSDIVLNFQVIRPEGAGLEDWINEYLAKNSEVDTIYWVMPKEEALDFDLRSFFGENKAKHLEGGAQLYGNAILANARGRFIVVPLTKKAYPQTFLIDPKTGILNEYHPGYSIVNELFSPNIEYKKVKIITCTEETLPNLAGKDVFLSIDADYTSNSGFDTTGDFKITKTPQEIENTFISIFSTLYRKNIQPKVISMSLSPEYVQEKDHTQIIQIMNNILKISGKKNALEKYTRFHPPELDEMKKEYFKE